MRWPTLLLAALLLSAIVAPAGADVPLEWDDMADVADEGLAAAGSSDGGAAGAAAAAAAAETSKAPPRQRPPFIVFKTQESWLMEGCALGLLLAFLVNMFVGRARNEKLALAWTAELVATDGVLERNFALLGPGDTAAGEVLLKDSMHCYKFWASGRRFCQGMLATFQLLRRQDLLAYSVQAVKSQKDVMELEVRMNEGSMPPLVLAIAPAATARTMQQEADDVKAFCKKMEPTRDRIAQWPDKLTVLAEHSSIFYELMTPQLLDLAFGKEAFESIKPYFRFLYITSESPAEPHKQVIRLSFALPAAGDAATLNKFLVLAMMLTDLVGSYRLTPEQLKRATDARQKQEAAQRAGQADERQRRTEERRQQKLQEEQDRLKRMGPEQRARELERKQKLQLKRQMSKMVKKK